VAEVSEVHTRNMRKLSHRAINDVKVSLLLKGFKSVTDGFVKPLIHPAIEYKCKT